MTEPELNAAQQATVDGIKSSGKTQVEVQRHPQTGEPIVVFQGRDFPLTEDGHLLEGDDAA